MAPKRKSVTATAAEALTPKAAAKKLVFDLEQKDTPLL